MTTLLMLPPQTATTREWAARVATTLPELTVVVAEDEAHAAREIGNVEVAFGTPSPSLLRQAGRLRWLQAPQAAPPNARNDEVAIPAGDLTFAKGYALRRAARQAAAQAASPKAAATQTATANVKVATADEPGVASEKQFGRPAVVAKRKPTAMAQYPRGERYGMFERFEGPRHQALAFGDSAPQRPVRRSGGWFDGLF